ncbi:putative lipase ATG15 [Cyberlindnera fabianii]|uniref:Putative lipase ATG15 n=1 Tax=Cyberlindnera fabianii TaxID=36022 RepID=A0A1V2L006_CYBFA|nr:putative lipase ATG15 [Cyberlindnera fabianii]
MTHQEPTPHQQQQQKTFSLKHIYHRGTKNLDDVHMRLDITPEFIEKNALHAFQIMDQDDWPTRRYRDSSPWTVKLPTHPEHITLTRLSDRDPDFVESYLDYARTEGSEAASMINLDWSDDLVEAPNVTDKDTIISLALMASNAYVNPPETGDWRDVNGFNHSQAHGWNGTGLRGHIFVSDDNSTVVIAYKGTSAAYLSSTGDDETVVEDKANDNLLFSCCCARVGYMWTTVCDCYKSAYTCDQRCLEKELYKKDKYYQAGLEVYRNVSAMYPGASIWTTGHSLGGAISSLVGRTFGLPSVSFEAPGELLATKRLHLPMPPGVPNYMEGIWHFGHTADPIFMGVCNGASSTCSMAGYAMETQCHSGKTCIYDVVGDKGWHVNLLNHRIHTVVDEVIEAYNETAPCVVAPPCRDCYNWNFVADGDSKRKQTHTSKRTSSTAASKTRTSDEPTPTPSKAPVCKKYTWYGRCVEWGYDDDDDDVGTKI